MKLTRVRLLAALCVMMITFTGCSSEKNQTNTTVVTGETTEQKDMTAVEDDTTEQTDKVASADEMAEPQEVIQDGMTPVYADSLKDGTYQIQVDSSSSMFNITSCELTVENGKMNAVMTMGGTGYLYVYMGTGEEAVSASEDAYIGYVESADGTHTFLVPVEALDKGLDCAAYSRKKEKWYDRTIVFRSDSLPVDAWKEGTYTSAEDLQLADGTYSVEISLEGGSGKATVESPANMIVENGTVTVTIVWSSSNYDYMVVNDEKYLTVNTDGNSTFNIPVNVFDGPMAVRADTTAMSEPHEIDYTLYFDSSTIQSVNK